MKNIFKSFQHILSLTFIVGLASGLVFALIMGLLIKDRLQIPYFNAVLAMLKFYEVPTVPSILVAGIIITYPIVFAILFVIYLINKIKNKKTIALFFTGLIFIFSFGINVKAESESFIQKLYNSENGLNGGCANDIVESSDGALWIATYDGLYRYNGLSFERITTYSGARSIVALYFDKDENLWIGNNGTGLTVVAKDGQLFTLDSESGLPSDGVRDIIETEENTYYLATTKGLAEVYFDGEKLEVVNTYFENQYIFQVMSNSNGEVITYDSDDNVCMILRNKEISYIGTDDANIDGIGLDEDDRLYVCTNTNIINIYEKNNGTYKYVSQIETGEVTGAHDLYFDESGKIFVAAESGIGYFDSDKKFHEIYASDFANKVCHVLKDYQGNIWFSSTRCGVLSLLNSNFKNVFSEYGVEENVVNTEACYEGQVFVGTDTGLIILDEKTKSIIENDLTSKLSDTRIRCMEVDSENNLWISSYGLGEFELEADGTIHEYSKQTNENISSDQTRVTYELNDGTHVVATKSGVYFIKDHELVKNLECGENFASAYALCISQRSDGTIFFGTDGDGIIVYKNNEITNTITRKEGLSTDVILKIIEDPFGEGEFILTGSGLCYLDEDYSVKEIENFPYYNNLDMKILDDGLVVFAGSLGIYTAGYDELMSGKNIDVTFYDSKKGFPASITSNSWNYLDENGVLYLSCTTGLYSLSISDLQNEEEINYKPSLRSFSLDGITTELTGSQDIKIHEGVTNVTFNIEINNFFYLDPTISVFLKGVDKEKRFYTASELKNISYEGIPYGSHELQIDVLDSNGNVVAENVYNIIKDKEIYETTGFLIFFYISVLIIVSSFICLIVDISGTITLKNQREEYLEIRNQLEIEKSKNLKKALLQEEQSNKEKLDSLASISHEIRTPINTILGLNTIILRETKEERTRKFSLDISDAGEKLLTIVNQLLKFSNLSPVSEKKVETTYETVEQKEFFHAPNAKILVVDDTQMNLIVAVELLKRIEAVVTTANSGKEALELTKENKYDVILMDAMMPEMSGEETMNRIKAECELNADTPVIVLTANAVDGAREEYLSQGFDNYLAKPIDSKRLEAMLECYLPKDKIISQEIDRTASEDKVKSNPEDILAKLDSIEEIDVKDGIETAGGEDIYLLVCQNFYETAADRLKLFKEHYNNMDIKNYTIQAHALKSSARLIGAYNLSERAWALEQAGRAENKEAIEQDTLQLIEDYRTLLKKMAPIYVNMK